MAAASLKSLSFEKSHSYGSIRNERLIDMRYKHGKVAHALRGNPRVCINIARGRMATPRQIEVSGLSGQSSSDSAASDKNSFLKYTVDSNYKCLICRFM